MNMFTSSGFLHASLFALQIQGRDDVMNKLSKQRISEGEGRE